MYTFHLPDMWFGVGTPCLTSVWPSARYPGGRGDVTMANDALSGTVNDWSKRKVEKKTTPSVRDWRRRRPVPRRHHRTSRATAPGQLVAMATASAV